jgi:hypothetical protein
MSIYFILLFLTTIFTFREFFCKNVENSTFPIAFLTNNLKKFNSFIQKTFKSILIFESGTVDILTLISIVFFFLTGYYNTNNPIVISLLLIFYEFVIIFFGKPGNGRLITLCLVSIVFFVIGYQFGQQRNIKKQQYMYFNNQRNLIY